MTNQSGRAITRHTDDSERGAPFMCINTSATYMDKDIHMYMYMCHVQHVRWRLAAEQSIDDRSTRGMGRGACGTAVCTRTTE
eukprot:7387284-Prymnesium_polylepis.1